MLTLEHMISKRITQETTETKKVKIEIMEAVLEVEVLQETKAML